MHDLIQFLNNFTHEILYIQFGLLLLLFVAIAMVWAYNRKKYHELSHQIPAGVVKSYLDSIIQNSTSLKSSLFRGGGLEMGQGVPSVLPIGNLKGGDSVSVDSEMLNQKNAEIASLQAKVSEKTQMIGDLEGRIKELEGKQGNPDAAREVTALKTQVKDLEAKLKSAQEALEKSKQSAGGDAGLKKELESVTKERDELKERLQEYEIIEDDLANLKKLQQENDQLRKALEAAGVAAPASEIPKKGPRPEAQAKQEEAPAEAAPAEEAPAPEAAAPEAAPAAEAPPAAAEPAEAAPAAAAGGAPETGEQGKSAEDLLSEFEKMLG